MGCCGCSSRATSIFAAIFSLIQGSAWLGLSVSGLLLYNCNTPLIYDDGLIGGGGGTVIDAITGLFTDFLTLTYFYNNDCELNKRPDLTVTVEGISKTIPWKNETMIATDRTYSWMMTYTILSSLWIATSILLLIVAVSNKKGATAGRLHYPWLLVMATIIVADVVATVIYCLDIPSTMGFKNFLDFVGAADTSELDSLATPPTMDIITAIPAIAMGVIFCRFIVIWSINLSVFAMVFSSAMKIGRTPNKPAALPNATLAENNPNPWSRSLQPPPSGSNPPPNSGQTAFQQRQLRYQDPDTFNNTPPPVMPKPTRNSMQQHPQQPYQYNNPQQHPQQPYQYNNPQQYPQQPHQNHPPAQYQQNQIPVQYQPNPVSTGGYQQNQQPSGRFQYPVPNGNPPQNYQNPPQSYSNQGYVNNEPVDPRSPAPDFRYEEVKPQRLLQKEPSLKGPPTAKKPTAPSGLHRNESLNTNTELRSQLPWSYVQHRDEQLPIKVQQKIDEDDEDAPPIPIPDYTLHFPRRPRGDQPKFQPTKQPTADKSRGYDVLY